MLKKSTLKILVLDDEPFMLKLLGRMLEAQGVSSVMLCDNGHAALGMVDDGETRPDVILLDINMPEMDGIEFLRHLAERHFMGSLVLISGEDERTRHSVEKLVHAHKMTLLGRMQKPASPEGLAALLDKWAPPAQGAPVDASKFYAADEVRAAIINGELVNFYQPKVAPATGRVVGMETLVRWQHPTDGMVLPEQFIGTAEANGLIDDLTRLVLTNALAQARVWQEARLLLQVAVNISQNNLAALEFVDTIAGLAAAAGVSHQGVVLEVSENRRQQDQHALLETMTRLRLKRFRLSLDHFGSGNSSQAQLQDTPCDELKIDLSLVHGAWANDMLRTKYNASFKQAKQLGLDVVAVGVEDLDDWDFIRRAGCNSAQGYFIGMPMVAAGIPAWIDDWQKRVSSGFRGTADRPLTAPSNKVDPLSVLRI